MMRFQFFLPSILALVLLLSQGAQAQVLRIYAASSMRDALQEIGQTYEKSCKCTVKYSFAASSILARQIDAGAKADLYISANREWVDWLDERGLLKGEQKVIAGNQLVIASTARTRDSFNILFRSRFSMADPTGVPAGKYAKQALESMGIWEQAQGNAVYTQNVRVALSMIHRGDLQSGIVYRSDLSVTPQIHAHFTFDEKHHEKIEYIAGVPKNASSLTQTYVEYLLSDEAQAILKKFGFLGVGTK